MLLHRHKSNRLGGCAPAGYPSFQRTILEHSERRRTCCGRDRHADAWHFSEVAGRLIGARGSSPPRTASKSVARLWALWVMEISERNSELSPKMVLACG